MNDLEARQKQKRLLEEKERLIKIQEARIRLLQQIIKLKDYRIDLLEKELSLRYTLPSMN